MDNLTHSLFGYALARTMPASFARDRPTRAACAWSSVLASNIPDGDFALGLFAHDTKLAYLLQHRGHTHTFLVALPLGLAVGLLSARLARVERVRDRVGIALLGALAALCHVLFDACNNYGVHPFYPVDNRWYYGDFVFIVEPLLLAAMLPLLAHGGVTRAGRAVGWFVGAALLALLASAATWMSTAVAAALAGVVVGGLLVGRFVRVTGRGTLLLVAAVLCVFFAGARVAEARVRASMELRAPGDEVLDVALTPLPGNPLCWSAQIATRDGADVYRVRRAALTLAPAWLPPDACRGTSRSRTTAPLRASDLPDTREMVIDGRFEAHVEDLRALAAHSCAARALLRFLRVPYWVHTDQGTVLGDLRFDRERDLEFAEMPVGDVCRDAIPAWIPPRADLLR